jgi:pimeloyl-ACP methyl ester carboxylesterase
MIHNYQQGIAHAKLAWNPRYDFKLDRRLGRVTAPTLLLKPDEDRIIPEGVAELWAALIREATVQNVPGDPGDPTGHLMILQQPRAIAQKIATHAAGT